MPKKRAGATGLPRRAARQPCPVTSCARQQTTSAPAAAPKLARWAIRNLLDGQEPNGTAPADCGQWADTLQALIDAHASGQAPAVKRAFDALAAADPGLARLMAGDPAAGASATPAEIPQPLSKIQTR